MAWPRCDCSGAGVVAILAELEADFGRTGNAAGYEELFSAYPILRPITVDSIHGGQWQGMVCDRCTCAGYFELCPATIWTEGSLYDPSTGQDMEALRSSIGGRPR